MNLIEEFGSYEKAKKHQIERALNGLLHEYDFELVDALLEYRREHGIFEDLSWNSSTDKFFIFIITVYNILSASCVSLS